MPETTRRVDVTLTIPTDQPPGEVLNGVLGALCDNDLPDAESATVRAFDVHEDDAPEPAVQFVIAHGHVYSVHVDVPELANEEAARVGGVVVELPITADHRNEVTA